jgi:hypothetical protein
MCSNYSLGICPRFLQPFTTLLEGWAPQALCSRISSSGTSRGPVVDVSTLLVDTPGPSAPTPHGTRMGTGGPPSTSSTSVVAAVGRCRQHSLRGPAINIFNFGGGRCRTLPPAPPRGACHRCLQLRWWSLSDLAASIPPRGPAIDVFNFSGGRCRTLPPHPPQGPTIDVFKFGGGRCRTLTPAPPGGPPSSSSTSMVAAARPCHQHPPQGPTIDVFNFGGGRCRTMLLASPPGGCH